jgi:hypothetical protein
MKIASGVGPAFLASVQLFITFHLQAQSPQAATLSAAVPAATLAYGSGKTLALRWDFYPDHQDFEPAGIYPDQILQINLQFPLTSAGKTISVSLDEASGLITTPTNSGAVTVGKDGSVSIGYQAPHDPGHYHVRFQFFGAHDSVLPFTVLGAAQAGKTLRYQKAD